MSIEDTLRTAGWVTSREAAQMLGVAQGYIRCLVGRGRLTPEHLGQMLFFQESDIWEYKRTHPRVGSRRAA